MRRVEDTIPLKFRQYRLEDLKPDPEVPDQLEAIPYIQKKPFLNYLLWGENGMGKSLMLWCMYRHASEMGRPAIACNVKTLLSEYQQAIAASREGRAFQPRLVAEQLLVRGRQWTICLDEFDKPKVTDWVAAELFEVIDAAFTYGHQIVVATNMMPKELIRKWEVEGGRYGASIGRRIIDGSMEIELRAAKAGGERKRA